MGNSIVRSFAMAACAGLSLGYAQASAGSLPLAGGSALFADAGKDAATRERATSAFDNMMDRFISIEAERSAAADAKSECPEEKKETQIAESQKDEKGDKDAPQGPEPIYFAF